MQIYTHARLRRALATLGIGLGIGAHSEAVGAVRSIQFSGLATVSYMNSDFGNLAHFGYCSVLVSNNSAAHQIVMDVKFQRVDALLKSRIDSVAPDGTQDARVVKSAFALTDPMRVELRKCIGETLEAGESCVFSVMTTPFAIQGINHTICSGILQVKDAVAERPGSVVASGALTVIQELQILGGGLTGALYSEGPEDPPSVEQPLTHQIFSQGPSLIAPSPPNPIRSPSAMGHMNVGCYPTCIANNAGNSEHQEACRQVCGSDGPFYRIGIDPTSPPMSPEEQGIQKPVRRVQGGGGSCSATATPGSPTSSCTIDPVISQTIEKWPDWPNPSGLLYKHRPTLAGPTPSEELCKAQILASHGASSDMRFEDYCKQNGGMAGLCMSELQSCRTQNRKAIRLPTAGGRVLEIQIGSKASICNGNLDSGLLGTPLTFEHGDSDNRLDGETLYCAHRHGEDELFGRIGQSVPFVINGGNAF
jgi:hypothetical protein